jgi:conjugal transfer ATP-binding protein TraC
MPKQTPTPPAPAPAKKADHPLLVALDDLLGLHLTEKKKKSTHKKSSRISSSKMLTEEEKTQLEYFEEGKQKMLDIIAPSAMEITAKDISINDLHARTLYVYNWPSYIYPNWLSQMVNLSTKLELTQFIYPTSNKAIMKVLKRKVTELQSSINMLKQRGMVRDPALEAALQDAEELRDLLARGQEKLFQFGLYVTIYAEDKEALKKTQTDIESILGGKLVLTKPSWFQMDGGWMSTLPICLDKLEINRNMNTSPLATSFPFSSASFTDDHGILYGINRHNDSLVIFDRFDLPNANSNVFAISGAGKSFAAKLELLRYLMLDTEVIIIDPENEYTDLCSAVDGAFVPLSIQSEFRINPFDLPRAIRGEESSQGDVLRSAIINLHGLLKLMLGDVSPAEEGILDKALLQTYANKGITLDAKDPGSMESPTLQDLVDILLKTEGGQQMGKNLEKYTVGSFAGLFNERTNVELNNKMIVFQIRDLEDRLRPIATYVILNFLWNIIRSKMRKRILVVDEAWNLMQHEDSARFLYGIVKRARKYYLGVTTITQDVDDFVNSPYGRPIITNSQMQLLLKQSPTTIDKIQKLFFLTEGEKLVLLNCDVGQGIMFAGHKHVAIQVIASPNEAELVTTKPEELLKRQAEQRQADINNKEKEKEVEKEKMKNIGQNAPHKTSHTSAIVEETTIDAEELEAQGIEGIVSKGKQKVQQVREGKDKPKEEEKKEDAEESDNVTDVIEKMTEENEAKSLDSAPVQQDQDLRKDLEQSSREKIKEPKELEPSPDVEVDDKKENKND